MRAYQQTVTIEHHDGTPDTEQVNLLCEDCFRNEWARQETGIADWQRLRDRVIREELRPAVLEAEIEGDSLAQLWDIAVMHDQVQGTTCEHLTAMQTYVIRLDLEVKAESQDEAGAGINQITEFITETEAIDLQHYRWAIVPASKGLDDPNLEKDFARAIFQ